MLKKGTKLYSILTGKCPRCHEESMYQHKNPYHPAYTITLHHACSHCGLKYQLEPSFFYGAMYVSYALGVALAVAVFVIVFLLTGLSLKTAFVCIIAALLLGMPVLMRLSRNIWINFFVGYEKSLGKN